VLEASSEGVFVPLTIGGGIRDFTDAAGTTYSALDVASVYFRSGADKVSIGSDAVEVALEYRRTGVATGASAIEQISTHYGRQAVVVSVDPKRVWVAKGDVEACPHQLVHSRRRGPKGEEHCWWQCTVKGGREARDLGAVELAAACEALGAGEVLLNNIDNDGAGQVRSAHCIRRSVFCWELGWRGPSQQQQLRLYIVRCASPDRPRICHCAWTQDAQYSVPDKPVALHCRALI
jgi:imidazole glycerol phosphate synthase subunit HisF